MVQCILSRQQIRLRDTIPGSILRWEHVTAPGLVWFEAIEPDYDYDTPGYLIAPYIWLWMLARLPPSEKNLLWLPRDHRPSSTAVRGNVVVLGHDSGRVSFLEFAL